MKRSGLLSLTLAVAAITAPSVASAQTTYNATPAVQATSGSMLPPDHNVTAKMWTVVVTVNNGVPSVSYEEQAHPLLDAHWTIVYMAIFYYTGYWSKTIQLEAGTYQVTYRKYTPPLDPLTMSVEDSDYQEIQTTTLVVTAP